MTDRNKENVLEEEERESIEICFIKTAASPAALMKTHLGTLKDSRAAYLVD
jgi:endonuclease/exonuclease/phosphatase family metal-dependent hydrolase